jgi:hypothetical protein
MKSNLKYSVASKDKGSDQTEYELSITEKQTKEQAFREIRASQVHDLFEKLSKEEISKLMEKNKHSTLELLKAAEFELEVLDNGWLIKSKASDKRVEEALAHYNKS